MGKLKNYVESRKRGRVLPKSTKMEKHNRRKEEGLPLIEGDLLAPLL